MRSYHVSSGAGIDGLSVRDDDVPAPGPGQALVAVRATSLSFRELLIVRGAYVLPVKPDVVPISDGAGEVVAVGDGVTRVRPGDRVMAAIFPNWLDGPFGLDRLPQLGGSLDGMLTEFAVLDEQALVPIPDHLTYQEAATLPCAAVTAWNALQGTVAGQTVVTLGSGGVSLFALQFAKALGARVIATTGSAEKEDRLRKLGADEVINYRATPDWDVKVRELTSGRGADRVVDVAGTVERSLKAVAMEGHVAFVGFMSGERQPVDLAVLFGSVASVRAVAAGSRAHFLAMTQLIGEHLLRPVIDRVFDFGEAPAAYRYYESAAGFGKVVIAHPAG